MSNFGQSPDQTDENIRQGACDVTSNASQSAGQTGEGLKNEVMM